MTAVLHAAGLGFWSPGHRDLAARLDGVRDAAEVEPACALLPPRMARRASLLTRMSIEAVSQAAAASGLDVREVPTVFATARGEMATLLALLDSLAGDGQLSPTRFHNSVYNAAAGQFSVAAGNRQPSTTVVAGDETVPMALLEGFCLAEERGAPALIVACADEALALPMVPGETEPLAWAVALVREARTGAPALARPVRRRDGAGSPSALANPVACALPMLAALRAGEGPRSFELPGGWSVEIAEARS